MLKNFFHRHREQESEDSSHDNVYPVMSADELYIKLQLHNKIRSIKRKVGLDPHRFEEMYAKPIARFCELVQLIPASQAYHHAFPGGLIVHTLSVAEYAINERYKYSLPLASEPEIIEAQRNLWTYMVFATVLIHDIGKAMTMVQFIDYKTKKIISPLAGTFQEQGIKKYSLRFRNTRYFKLHERIGCIFLGQIFDGKSLDFLSRNLDVFSELLGYVHQDAESWGSVGEIVRIADQNSVADDLRIAPATGRRRQFAGAEIENFGERLMRCLRLLIEKRQIAINRPGAVLFTSADSKYVYAVAKSLAEHIRETMQQMGAYDVPGDNSRIFDELQQNGLILTNNNGKAIFNIAVSISSGNFNQKFTVLKFEYRKVFSVGNQPLPLSGTVEEIDKDIPDSAPVNHETEQDSVLQPVNIEENSLNPQANECSNEHTDQNTEAVISTEKNDTDGDDEEAPDASSVNTPDKIIDNFFEWLLQKIENKEFIVNRSGNPVYKISLEGKPCLAIVTPKTFADFAVDEKLFQTDEPLNRKTMVSAAAIVQSAIHKEHANIRCRTRQVHYLYSTTSQSAKARLSCYVFAIDKIRNDRLKKILNDFEVTEILTKGA